MKKNALLVSILIFLQSCHSYKTTAIKDVEVEKYYVMQLNNEMKVRGVCHKITDDTLQFRVKHRLLEYSKNDIGQIKKKKVSAIKSVGLLAIITTGAVLSVTTNTVESAFSQTRPR